MIDERFAVRGDHGVDIEILGCTGEVPGGGFLYTNAESLAVGLVLSLPKLAACGRRPEEILAELKAHSAIAPLIEGGQVKEYSAHVIPEAGYKMMPELIGDGILVAGDAAAMCLAAGIWLEGVNFAIGSGAAAGQAAARAVQRRDTSSAGLQDYRRRLDSNFVMEQLFTVTNPDPKPGLRKIIRGQMKLNNLKLRDAISQGMKALRTFG